MAKELNIEASCVIVAQCNTGIHCIFTDPEKAFAWADKCMEYYAEKLGVNFVDNTENFIFSNKLKQYMSKEGVHLYPHATSVESIVIDLYHVPNNPEFKPPVNEHGEPLLPVVVPS